MHYWLMKSEPAAYSIDDLKRDRVGMWDGVRGYQARNTMRDLIKKGDLVLFYHSSADIIGVMGIAKVEREAYPDPTQFDAKSEYYDPKSKPDAPRWVAIDVRFVKKFKAPITLQKLKTDPKTKDMLVTKQGMRLSVQPVSEKHYVYITKLASQK